MKDMGALRVDKLITAANDHALLLAAIVAGKAVPSSGTVQGSGERSYWLVVPRLSGVYENRRVELDSFGCPILTPELRAALTEVMK